jgi:hypothetical protein
VRTDRPSVVITGKAVEAIDVETFTLNSKKRITVVGIGVIFLLKYRGG